MKKHFSPNYLRMIRNEIPINTLIDSVLEMPTKISENQFRFLCPLCNEFQTAVNKKTNLARCFRCKKNFNPIDMAMIVNNCGFIDSVQFLGSLPRLGKTSAY